MRKNKFWIPLIFCFLISNLSAKRPNILFILTDDQAPHTLSAYGNKICQTPHLDKLAASGMGLDQAYHMGSMSGAVCSPSRTMIMSGRTLWHLPPRGKKYLKNEEGKATGADILNNTFASNTTDGIAAINKLQEVQEIDCFDTVDDEQEFELLVRIDLRVCSEDEEVSPLDLDDPRVPFLEDAFVTTYNDLVAEKYCDPFYRIMKNATFTSIITASRYATENVR